MASIWELMRRGGSGVSKRASTSVLRVGMLKIDCIEIASVVHVRDKHREDL